MPAGARAGVSNLQPKGACQGSFLFGTPGFDTAAGGMKVADAAAIYRVAVRTILEWRAAGRAAGDPCPLDDPAALARWWVRRRQYRIPSRICELAGDACPRPTSRICAAPECCLWSEGRQPSFEEVADWLDGYQIPWRYERRGSWEEGRVGCRPGPRARCRRNTHLRVETMRLALQGVGLVESDLELPACVVFETDGIEAIPGRVHV